MPYRPGHYLITGCSGGGKSTLIDALAAQGFATIPEPGRRILQLANGPDDPLLPWNDPESFANAALNMARRDLAAIKDSQNPVFFDRGLFDAAVALFRTTGKPVAQSLAPGFPYAAPVFLAPPWPELFRTDCDRRHDFNAARAEFDALSAALSDIETQVLTLPKASLQDRLTFVRAAVSRN